MSMKLRSVVWLRNLNGVQVVVGSNPTGAPRFINDPERSLGAFNSGSANGCSREVLIRFANSICENIIA